MLQRRTLGKLSLRKISIILCKNGFAFLAPYSPISAFLQLSVKRLGKGKAFANTCSRMKSVEIHYLHVNSKSSDKGFHDIFEHFISLFFFKRVIQIHFDILLNEALQFCPLLCLKTLIYRLPRELFHPRGINRCPVHNSSFDTNYIQHKSIFVCRRTVG